MQISAAFETQLWYMLLARAIREARSTPTCEHRRVESACESDCCDQQGSNAPSQSYSAFLECDNRIRSYDVYIVERTADRCNDLDPYWHHLERGNECHREESTGRRIRGTRGARGARRHRFDCDTTGSILDCMS